MRETGEELVTARQRAHVRESAAVDRQQVKAGRATEMQVLIGPDEGAANFWMRRFIMGEGGGMPRHTNEVEHEQFVLRGRARIGIADEVLEVKAGDVVYIPARQPHFYEVVEAPFEFLCMVPNSEDQIRVLYDPEQDPSE